MCSFIISNDYTFFSVLVNTRSVFFLCLVNIVLIRNKNLNYFVTYCNHFEISESNEYCLDLFKTAVHATEWENKKAIHKYIGYIEKLTAKTWLHKIYKTNGKTNKISCHTISVLL